VPNTQVHLSPGQLTYTFKVHVYDNGMNGPPVQAHAYLFGSWPDQLGTPNDSPITILRDDPIEARDPGNPLGLSPAPTDGNVLQDARFYVAGASSPAGQAEAQYQQSDPAWAQALGVIADQPGVYRFSPASGGPIGGVVARYLLDASVSDPGTVPLIATYYLVDGHCGNWADSQAAVASYQSWIAGVAQGIGNFDAVLFLEMDSLITAGCLSTQGLQIRVSDELAYAVSVLERDPHLVVYLDAGAADAVPWKLTAQMLRQAGVAQAQGFFLNSTHFDWTTSELYYGQRIARVLGGAHFVINTGENGRGPLVPRNRAREGNEVLCNPPGRGLGPLTTSTGYRWADAFLWTSDPGESGGACVPGAPPTAAFWPAYAVALVDNALNRVTGPAYPLVTTAGTVLHVPRRPKHRARDQRSARKRRAKTGSAAADTVLHVPRRPKHRARDQRSARERRAETRGTAA